MAKPIFSPKARSAKLALVAAAALLLYLALGFVVSSRPPGLFDRAGEMLAGQNLGLALVAYRSGLFPTYAAIAAALIVFALFVPRWRGRVAFSVIALLAGWVISDFFKSVFHRPRPTNWVGVHETSNAYSSGHATLSLIVYGLWAYFLWQSELPTPVRAVASGTLVLWCLIIAWSRLAMGAHYPTDILGGWLLGIAVLAGLGSLVALIRRKTL